MAIVDEIYQQFIDYFGEDRVDLQRYSPNTIKVDSYHSSNCSATDYIIVVHWPVVTVANEFDNTIDIWDLYSATIIATNGKPHLLAITLAAVDLPVPDSPSNSIE